MDKKIAEKLKDKAFVEKLMGFETTEEVKNFFKSEGLSITDEEIKEMGNSIKESLSNFQSLSDKELEVSGGFQVSDIVGKMGHKIGVDNPENVDYDQLLVFEGVAAEKGEPASALDDSFKEGTRGKIGKALFVHRKGITAGTGVAGIAAATLVAYASCKKGWPALKALGQKKGWWKWK